MANTIIDVLEKQGTFDILVSALKRANLDKTLQEAGPYTVFAPTDDAVAAMPDWRFTRWYDDMPRLVKVLKFHGVNDRMNAADLLERSFVKTLEGERLHITSRLDDLGYAEAAAADAYGYVMGGTVTVAVKQTIKVNGAAIVQVDLEAENGFVHGIDKVLIPWLIDLHH